LVTLGLSIVAVAGLVMLLQGNASATDRATVTATVQEPVVADLGTPPVPSEVKQQVAVAQPTAQARGATSREEKKAPARARRVAKPAAKPGKQVLRIAIGSTGYEPGTVRASAGRPIVLTVGKGEGCAAGFLIPKLGVDKDNSRGPITVNLGTVPPGKYRFSCGMEMVSGTLIVE
jgi:hypothetical protein